MRFGVFCLSLLSLNATAMWGQSDFVQGRAIAHDGTEIPFEIYGTAQHALLLGPGTAPVGAREVQRGFIDALGDRYRLIFISYPTEPKMYTLTPAAVARDYLAIADAAGVERFAYYGYSWGCVTGLQLALRTDRLEALACGGFPVIDGPYAEMLEITRTMEQGPATLFGFEVPHRPEAARQFVTYYEGLQSFDDRAMQEQLTVPRLTFAGSGDDVTLNGKLLTRIGQNVIDHREELKTLGWDVEILAGKDHVGALAPDVAAPLVRRWLDGKR